MYTDEQLKDMNADWIKETNTQWSILDSPKAMTPPREATPPKATPLTTKLKLKTKIPNWKKTWKSLTKKEIMSLRRKLRRRIKQAKMLPPTKMGPCYHCHNSNCLSFQGLNNLSNKQKAKTIINRLRDHHPLYSCHILWKCPQEHNMLHRILYHHPLYSPNHLIIIRLMLLAKLKLGSYHLPKIPSWASLKIPNLKEIQKDPSNKQLQRQHRFRTQLLPNRNSLELILPHLTKLEQNPQMLDTWLNSLASPQRKLIRKLEQTSSEILSSKLSPLPCKDWPDNVHQQTCQIDLSIWDAPMIYQKLKEQNLHLEEELHKKLEQKVSTENSKQPHPEPETSCT